MDIYKFKLIVSLYENDCNFEIHKDLGISRTNLWWHINAMEKELETPIIIRGKHKNSFTDFGILLAKRSKKIIQEYEDLLEEKFESYFFNEDDHLIFSTTAAVGSGQFFPLFEEFQKSFPNINLTIFAGDELPAATESLSHIHFRPFDEKENIQRKWFIKYTQGLYASKDYLARWGTPNDPLELKNHKIISYGHHVFSYFEDINWHLKGKYGGLPKLKSYLSINSTMAIYRSAARGTGICSSSIELNELEGSKLIRILPEVEGPVIRSYFTVRKNLSSAVQNNVLLFEDFLRSSLENAGIAVYQD